MYQLKGLLNLAWPGKEEGDALTDDKAAVEAVLADDLGWGTGPEAAAGEPLSLEGAIHMQWKEWI